MDIIYSDQICSICGKVIPIQEVYSNTLFEEARCDSCYNTYGAVPLETLKAQIISTNGMEIKDLPKDTWHELIMLQIKKQALKSETEEKITRAKGSLLSIGRDSKIERIRQEAIEARNKINQEIELIVMLIPHGLKITDIPEDVRYDLNILQVKIQALRSETEGKIIKAKKSIKGIAIKTDIERIKHEAVEEREKIKQEMQDVILSEIKQTREASGTGGQ